MDPQGTQAAAGRDAQMRKLPTLGNEPARGAMGAGQIAQMLQQGKQAAPLPQMPRM